MDQNELVRIPDKSALEAEYQQNNPLYQYALLVLEHRIRETLESVSIRPSIKGRIKSSDSLYAKRIRIKMKAHLKGEDPIPVTDVIAVRAICPFLGDLDLAEKAICTVFKVVELERKGSERSFREFGYESIHMLAQLPPDLQDASVGLDQPVFEIQLRTILQEAWAEVEHELVYKAEFTPFDEPLKRKLAALNANLSLSDIIFQEILDYQRRLNSELERRRSAFHDKIEETMDRPMNLPVGVQTTPATFPGTAHDMLLSNQGTRQGEESGSIVSAQGTRDARNNIVPEYADQKTKGIASAHLLGTVDLESGKVIPKPTLPDRMLTLDELLLSALEAHNREDYKRATDLYSEILNQAPGKEISSVVLKHRGMAYFSQSRYDLAIDDFERSLEYDPACYKSAYYRGVVKSVLQDYSGAIVDFNLALDIHPFHFWSRYRRAMAFFQIADYPQSLSDCEAALKLKPDNQLASGLRDMARSKIKF
ncbi:MAG: tetratricopeptide repeat protein [Rectinemataceae bacterium]|nr:tetratricopeptide repeat protein [Rectinemataceae bacterium]